MNWRLALRLARREVARRPGRAVLVTLLVAIPVCGMTVAAVLFRTEQLSPAQEFRIANGGADASRLVDEIEAPAGSATHLPAGSRLVDIRWTDLLVRGSDSSPRFSSVAGVALEEVDLGDRYRLVDGQAPSGPGEVALSRQTARGAGAGIGDEVVLAADVRRAGPSTVDSGKPDHNASASNDEQQVTVVGLVEDSTCLQCWSAVVHPDQQLPQTGSFSRQLADLPDDTTEDELRKLSRGGWEIAPDLLDDFPNLQDSYSDDSTVKVAWALVVGVVALTAAGIVISAAFAVSARRQLTMLGQLSASGASPSLLRRTLALQGTVSGVLGLAVGGMLTALILGLGQGRIEELGDSRLPAWDVRLADLAAIAVVGVTAATVAALLPAGTAARVPTLNALAGRRPLTPVPRHLTLGGLAAIQGGLTLTALAVIGSQGTGGTGDAQVWALVAIAGGVLQLLGACAVTPALASQLEPLGSRLRGPWRLGARSLARNRTRTGAVVAAVAAVGALTVVGGGLVRGFQAREDNQNWYELPDDMVVASVERDVHASGPDSEPDQQQGTTPAEAAEAPDIEASEEEATDAATPTTAVPLGALDQPPVKMPPDEETIAGIESLMVNGSDANDLDTAGSDTQVERVTVRRTAQSSVGQEWTVTAGGSWAAATAGAVVADEAVLDMFEAPEALRDRLASDEVVFLWALEPEHAAEAEDVTVTLPDGTERPAIEMAGVFPDRFGALAISPELAESLDLAVEDVAVAMRSSESLTEDQRDRLDEIAMPGGGATTDGWLEVWFNHPSNDLDPVTIEMLLSAAAVVIALLVTGISLALSAAESRDEREVFTVVGTRPRDLARSAGARAGLLALLGAALAVPLGLAQVTVVSWTWSDGLPIRPPWLTLALILVIVPVLAMLSASTASAIAQRARPIRISTATFE